MIVFAGINQLETCMQVLNDEMLSLLPATPWRKGWMLRTDCWTGRMTPARWGGFITLNCPCDIGPDGMDPAWSLHISLPGGTAVPQQCIFLSNGLVALDRHTANGISMCAFTPEPGVLWGISRKRPTLFAPDATIEKPDEYTCILQENNVQLRLMVRPDRGMYKFSLACRHREAPSAYSLTDTAEHLRQSVACYLDINMERFIGETLLLRRSYWQHHSCDASLSSCAIRHLEELVRLIQPAHNRIPFRWMCRDINHPGIFDIDRVFALTDAWVRIDPAVAGENMLAALSIQEQDGFIPAWVEITGESADTPCRPMLAQSVRKILEVQPDQNFLRNVTPDLIRYINGMLSRYVTEPELGAVWPAEQTALSPSLYRPGVPALDATCLVLAEIEAALECVRSQPDAMPFLTVWQEYQRQLSAALTSRFYESASGLFKEQDIDSDSFVDRITLGTLLPLLCDSVPDASLARIYPLLDAGSPLLSATGIQDWEYWRDDAVLPPVEALHQLLVIDGLQRRMPAWEKTQFNDVLQQFAQNSEKNDTERIEPTQRVLCLGVSSHAIQHRTDREQFPPALQFLDRHALTVSAVTCVAGLLFLIGICTAQLSRTTLTRPAIETIAGMGQLYYQHGDYDHAIPYYARLSQAMNRHPRFELMLGNAHFRKGAYRIAEQHYRHVLRNRPQPAALMNLALTLYHQGRPREAADCYAQVIDLFERQHPEISHRAALSIDLIRQQLRNPYSLLHRKQDA
jgi:tetratricopeptide (TPR) repeat protein